jgi:hypothetical protein
VAQRSLICGAKGCREPFAFIEGDTLVVRSRHHGRVHENRRTWAELMDEFSDADLQALARLIAHTLDSARLRNELKALGLS